MCSSEGWSSSPSSGLGMKQWLAPLSPLIQLHAPVENELGKERLKNEILGEPGCRERKAGVRAPHPWLLSPSPKSHSQAHQLTFTLVYHHQKLTYLSHQFDY